MNTSSNISNSIEACAAKLEPYEKEIGPLFRDLKNISKKLQDDLKGMKEKEGLLRIAVIGQVKAGKSSFLNALLFNGQKILPKAATPMTAALTVISYSPEIKAKVEFFSKDEWKNIEGLAAEYSREYGRAKEQLEEDIRQMNESGGLFGKKTSVITITDDKIRDLMNVNEEVTAAFEVVEMARKNNLEPLQYLNGKPKTIDGVTTIEDLLDKMEDYVGANGKYTPIVRNTYIYYNEPQLKGIEIIDTPGMNDPVISRGKRTKDFLGQCDVAFVLCYSGVFLDQSDLQVLVQNIPSSGIKEVVLIGTQLDSVMLQTKRQYHSITQLLVNVEEKLSRQANDTFTELANGETNPAQKEVFERLKKNLPPIFISAMAYNIAMQEHQLDEEEKHNFNLYNSMYDDFTFDKETLLELSNMEVTGEILQQQKEKKDQTLSHRVQDRVAGATRELQQLLRKIKDDTERKLRILANEDLKSLKEKERNMVGRLEKGRNHIEMSFENAIIHMKKEFSLLLTEMKNMSREFAKTRINTETKYEEYEVSKFKLFKPSTWGKTETQTRTISYRYANIYDSIEQVEEFVYESEKRLKEAILDIVDIPKLRSQIKNGVLGLFDLSDEHFDIDTIVLPIERAVNQITIPEVDFGNKDYASFITSEFSTGQVRDSTVEQLQVKQREVVHSVFADLEKATNEKSREITTMITSIQKEFVNKVIENIQTDLDELRSQLEDKEKARNTYEEITRLIHQLE